MIFLYILLGIAALAALLLMMRASLTVEYGEKLKLYATFLGLRHYYYPKKKKKYKLSHYTEKKVQRRLAKEEKRKAKRAQTEETGAASETAGEPGILDKLDIVFSILKAVIGRFSNHVKIRIYRFNVNVATGDAATTAIVYGAVTQAVAYAVEALDCTTDIKASDININADFIGEKTTADIKITIRLRVWQVLDIMVRGMFEFLKNKNT